MCSPQYSGARAALLHLPANAARHASHGTPAGAALRTDSKDNAPPRATCCTHYVPLHYRSARSISAPWTVLLSTSPDWILEVTTNKHQPPCSTHSSHAHVPRRHARRTSLTAGPSSDANQPVSKRYGVLTSASKLQPDGLTVVTLASALELRRGVGVEIIVSQTACSGFGGRKKDAGRRS